MVFFFIYFFNEIQGYINDREKFKEEIIKEQQFKPIAQPICSFESNGELYEVDFFSSHR